MRSLGAHAVDGPPARRLELPIEGGPEEFGEIVAVVPTCQRADDPVGAQGFVGTRHLDDRFHGAFSPRIHDDPLHSRRRCFL